MTHLIHSALSEPRRPLAQVSPKTKLVDCIDLLIKQNIGALAVLEGETLVGMVTERDIVRGLHEGVVLDSAVAEDVVYREVSVLNISDPVETAMETITKTKRRHVLVEENGKLVAMLSIGDVLFHLLEDKARMIEHLEDYIHTY